MALINKKRRFSPREERIIHESELFGINKKRRFTSPRQRSIDEFELFDKIGEGAYGVVYRARDKKTGEIVAVKKVKPDGKELPETNILARLNHPSIVDLKHVITGVSGSDSGSVFLVMEYAENDIRSLLKTMRHPFSQSEVKYLMQELLQGVDHLHRNQILHRDLKTSNLLFNNRGELKICDFGLACRVNNDMVMHTETVVTLWYRAPELLLGVEEYSAAVDMWSVGCIMAELLLRQPLFYGETESDQLTKIFKILGSPSEAIWPGFAKLKGAKVACLSRNQRTSLLKQKFQAMSVTGSALLSNAGVDLLNRLLTYDPRKRMTAEEALNHSWFREVPRPKSRDFMPTYPPKFAIRW